MRYHTRKKMSLSAMTSVLWMLWLHSAIAADPIGSYVPGSLNEMCAQIDSSGLAQCLELTKQDDGREFVILTQNETSSAPFRILSYYMAQASCRSKSTAIQFGYAVDSDKYRMFIIGCTQGRNAQILSHWKTVSLSEATKKFAN